MGAMKHCTGFVKHCLGVYVVWSSLIEFTQRRQWRDMICKDLKDTVMDGSKLLEMHSGSQERVWEFLQVER